MGSFRCPPCTYVLGGAKDDFKAVQDLALVEHADEPHVDHEQPPAVAAVGHLCGSGVGLGVGLGSVLDESAARNRTDESLACLGDEWLRGEHVVAELGVDDRVHEKHALG